MERQRILRAGFNFAEVVLFDANRVVHVHVTAATVCFVAVYNAWGITLLLELNHICLQHLALNTHPIAVVTIAASLVEGPCLSELQLAHVIRCFARIEGHSDVAEQTQADQTR